MRTTGKGADQVVYLFLYLHERTCVLKEYFIWGAKYKVEASYLLVKVLARSYQ